MSVALKKLEAVESVNVSLNKGLADIGLRSGNTLKLEDVRRVVRNGGFTPKEAEVVAFGRVKKSGDDTIFEVTGAAESYEVRDAPGNSGKTAALLKAVADGGETLSIRGTARKQEERNGFLLQDFSVETR